jgi:BolA protein
MSAAELIKQKLAGLDPESLEIVDESSRHAGHEGARGGGGHYRLTIVSRRFAGQPAQARHRMVYDALGGLMRKEIHALAIKACTPEEL